ncbi:FIST C-terminal domain-containing protein [candidate division WOR-3 bacterium]|nr:FIST C-terminal domain-containing protein [candidate division WOR-3 bacterium]
MKALSHFSLNPDPYKAGIQIAEKVAEIDPEIVFLFPTIHYGGSPETAEAFYDVIQKEELFIVGNTGEGFYEKKNIANAGVSALAINSEGNINWFLTSQKDAVKNPYEAAKLCIEQLNEKCDSSKPLLYYIASVFKSDAQKIVKALSESVNGPLIGGLAGDDNSFNNSFVYAGKEVFDNGIVALAINGAFRFDIKTAHELHPIGIKDTVTDTEGTKIIKIGGIPAMDFVERELGKPIDLVDQGVITFKVTGKDEHQGHQIRSLLLPEEGSTGRGVNLFSAVDEGSSVQVCLASPEMILKDISDIALSLKSLDFEPVAALVVSCAGRKKVLANDIISEVQKIVENCPSIKGLAGFPSFGEFGSVKNKKEYSKPLFHNMTFFLLLLGD